MTLRRGGTYLRVVDPRWTDPADPEYSRAAGGRWNPPDTFGVLYLNADLTAARANLNRRFAGQPYTVDDLAEDARPQLLELTLATEEYSDAVSPTGLAELGLPRTYPLDSRGRIVPHSRCQPIGATLYADGSLGVVARSAADGGLAGEELAWFAQPGRTAPAQGRRIAFADWYTRTAPA